MQGKEGILRLYTMYNKGLAYFFGQGSLPLKALYRLLPSLLLRQRGRGSRGAEGIQPGLSYCPHAGMHQPFLELGGCAIYPLMEGDHFPGVYAEGVIQRGSFGGRSRNLRMKLIPRSKGVHCRLQRVNSMCMDIQDTLPV